MKFDDWIIPIFLATIAAAFLALIVKVDQRTERIDKYRICMENTEDNSKCKY